MSSSTKEISKSKVDKENEDIEFNEELNRNLEHPIFSTNDIDFAGRPSLSLGRVLEKNEVQFDLYQISENWIKIRSSKTKTTWVITKDSFIKGSVAVAYKIDSDESVKAAVKAISPKAKNAEKDDELLGAGKPIVMPLDSNTMSIDNTEDIVTEKVWNYLCKETWSSQLDYNVADSGATIEFIASVISPRSLMNTDTSSGLNLLDPKSNTVVQTKVNGIPMTFECNGDVDDETGQSIWRCALNPIAWFGKEAVKKPSKISDYDDPEVALDSPTDGIKLASLKEDEAFGYAV